MVYRTVNTELWFDPDIMALRPTPNAIYLFLYLFQNSHTHVSGIYHISRPTMTEETGLPAPEIDTLLDTLSSVGLARYDTTRCVIYVPAMYGKQARGEKNELAAAKQLLSLHNSPLIKEFLQAYPAVKARCEPSFLDSVSNGYPSGAGTEAGSGKGTGTNSIGSSKVTARAETGIASAEKGSTKSREDAAMRAVQGVKGKRRAETHLISSVKLKASDSPDGYLVGKMMKALGPHGREFYHRVARLIEEGRLGETLMVGILERSTKPGITNPVAYFASVLKAEAPKAFEREATP